MAHKSRKPMLVFELQHRISQLLALRTTIQIGRRIRCCGRTNLLACPRFCEYPCMTRNTQPGSNQTISDFAIWRIRLRTAGLSSRNETREMHVSSKDIHACNMGDHHRRRRLLPKARTRRRGKQVWSHLLWQFNPFCIVTVPLDQRARQRF